MLKIFFSVNYSGCSWWRARQPAAMIRKLNLAEVCIFSTEDISRNDMAEIFQWADVIMTQSPAGIDSIALTLKYQEMGKVVIADYDDLVYSCSPFNPGYKTLGMKEVKIKQKDGTEIWFWKDGEKGFSIKDNYFRYKAQIDLLNVIDGLTVTNEYLLEKYLMEMPEESGEKSFILPNSIDFDLFKPFEKRENKKVRIGWLASSSHFNEAWMMKDIIESILKKYNDTVQFVLLGDVPELWQLFKEKIEYHHFVDLSIYPLKLAALNLDIGICPLVKDEFNSYKSPLKWSEYSAYKIPAVVTDFPPYDCVEEGVTGLKAGDTIEFFDKLCLLVENKKLREDIGNNAFEKNYQDFNLKTNAKLWVEAYQACYDRVFSKKEAVKQ